MQSPNLQETVRKIREVTSTGIVNLNSNASRPIQLKGLFEVGLNSLRISTNSARGNVYTAYYRPTTYSFESVRESARVARAAGAYLMLNYFVFPGVTDTAEELEALSEWISEADINMIQLRNLNMDPEVYLETVGDAGHEVQAMGILPWLTELRRRFPRLRFGYFNPPQKRFSEAPSLLVGQSG